MFIEQLVATPKHVAGEKYDERIETANFLIGQGWAKAATRELPPLEVHWTVSRDELTGAVVLHGKCNHACGAFHFFGDPALLARDDFRFFHGCLSEPTRVPQSVVERYRAQRNDAAAHPVAAESRETMGLADAEAISKVKMKRLDGARLTVQIETERKARKRLGY
jgi:hypothetical protein